MVDAVAATSSGLGTTSSAALQAAGASTLNYESFLMLLVTQMQNQDPTNPMDAGEQMAQLASFSTVEQQIKTNAHLEDLLSLNLLGQATGMVGKQLTTADGETSGIVASVAVNSNGLSATLEDGTSILIQEGVTISMPQAASDETDTTDSADNSDTTDTTDSTDTTDTEGGTDTGDTGETTS
ncbi:flagellar hook assembly protein FlgD [Rhizobium sp. L1K21]|uniref:flagellar hook assembly protein FlgD n=1 Tax=Rhizobium sp. L1K21 TaxID=2954933 RepID=UPI003594277B